MAESVTEMVVVSEYYDTFGIPKTCVPGHIAKAVVHPTGAPFFLLFSYFYMSEAPIFLLFHMRSLESLPWMKSSKTIINTCVCVSHEFKA